jgi:hypothetical protein
MLYLPFFLFLVSDPTPPATDAINDVTLVDPVTPVDPNTIGLTQHFCFVLVDICCIHLGVYFLFTHTFKNFVLVPENVTSALVIKDGTAGPVTFDRKNRHKRAAKEAGTPPKMKKIKFSQDVDATYQKFVQHGRKFKRQPKNHIP